MRFFIFLILIFTSYHLYSQNYFEYYKNVNNAGIAIIEAKYDSALYYYQKAFKDVKVQYAKDLYNAAICASYTGNNIMGIQYVERILRKGMTFNIFKKESFKGLKSCKEWKALKKKSKSLIIDGRNKWDIQLRKKIDDIYNDDQYFRKKRGSYSLYGDTISKIDSINFIKLSDIILKYGYPDENNLGFKKPWDIDNTKFYIIVRHYYQNRGYLLSDILYKEVKKGHLLPNIYAELEDKKNNYLVGDDKYGTIVFFKINGKIKENKRTNEQIQEYNKNRKLLGLESYDDYKKKVLFMEGKTPFYFSCSEGIVILITKK